MDYSGLHIVVAVVGDDSIGAAESAQWRATLTKCFQRLARQYPHSPMAVLTARALPIEQLAAEVAAEAGWKVLLPPQRDVQAGQDHQSVIQLPGHLLDSAFRQGAAADDAERNAELICRYAHLLITFETHRPAPDHSMAGRVSLKWRQREFIYGDEEDDNDAHELLCEPALGGAGRLRLTKGRTTFEPRWPYSLLRELDSVNRDMLAADHPRVVSASQSLAPDSDMEATRAAVGAGEAQFLTGLGAIRGMFGRTDAAAIVRKRRLDRFNVAFAAAAPLSILGYEAGRLLSDTVFALGLYVAVIAVALAFSWFYMLRRRQRRMQMLRVTAELLRVQFFWRVAGVPARLESTLGRWSPNEHVEVQFIARSLDLQAAMIPPPSTDLTRFVHRLWVGPPKDAPADVLATAWPGAQTQWYPKRAFQLHGEARGYGVLQVGSFLTAILAAIAALVLDTSRSGINIYFLVLPAIAVLPTLAGAFSMVRERMSLPTLAENYERLGRVANAASKRLTHLAKHPDPKRIRRVIEQFGREVLGESMDWLQTHSQKRIPTVVTG